MSLKCIIFDIDGTLVNKHVPSVDVSIIEAINQAKSLGIKICLATGRPLHLIDLPIIKALQPDAYVTLNGQCCMNADFQMVYDQPLDLQTVQDFQRFSREHHLEFGIHTLHQTSFNTKGSLYEIIEGMLGREHGDVMDFSDLPWNDVIYTFIVYTQHKELIHQFVNDHPTLRVDQFKPHCSDIFNANANKAQGINQFLKLWDLTWDEVLSFGDNTNDIEMLTHSKWGIVVEGGPKIMESLNLQMIPFYQRQTMASIIIEKMTIDQ